MLDETSWARIWRAVGIAVAGVVLAAAGVRWFAETGLAAWRAVTTTELARPDDAVLVLVAALGALLVAWLGAGIVVGALARLPGAVGRACSRIESQVAPAVLRRVVGVLVGATVVAGSGSGPALAGSPMLAQGGSEARASTSLSLPAHGAGTAPDPAFAPSSAGADLAQSGSAPDPAFAPTTRADLGPRRASTRPSASASTDRPEVVVKRGDTLWDIAAAHLPSGAANAEILAACHQWYTVNKHVIGADPDLILPGQRLIAPPPHPGSR